MPAFELGACKRSLRREEKRQFKSPEEKMAPSQQLENWREDVSSLADVSVRRDQQTLNRIQLPLQHRDTNEEDGGTTEPRRIKNGKRTNV
ncbi:hypothetical protein EYF80_050507 [Liparis tanakae]|uniref:Uncharacterized protein n=1 Tax=Liparis tanakae TaxID=230148 RepID=A0A4Z2FDR9_9TELE|nr:hypothetical protein EYF80_050507 [Liparis tanakae]